VPLASHTQRQLRSVGPWLVAAGIFVFLFVHVPASEAWRSVLNARFEIFLPAVGTVVWFWFLAESKAYSYLFSRFNAPLAWSEARVLRGATYLLTPVNWNLGTVAIVLHLRRVHGVPAVESSSSILYFSAVDGLVLAGCAILGVVFLPESPTTTALGGGALVLGALALIAILGIGARRSLGRVLDRLREKSLFRTPRMATLRDLTVLVLLRGIYMAGFVWIFWSGAHAFGVDVPLAVAVSATPGIILAAALPITPVGLGTQAAAMLFFFGPHGGSAEIVAFGLAFPLAVTLVRSVLGLAYLRSAQLLHAERAHASV